MWAKAEQHPVFTDLPVYARDEMNQHFSNYNVKKGKGDSVLSPQRRCRMPAVG